MNIPSGRKLMGMVGCLLVCLAVLVPAHAQEKTLQVMIWESPELNMDEMGRLIEAFAREYRLGATLWWAPFDDYQQHLQARLAAGDAPDLFWATKETLLDLAEGGWIVPLDEALRTAPTLLVSRDYRFGGRQYGIPVGPADAPLADMAFVVSTKGRDRIEIALQFVGYLTERWHIVCCFELAPNNPPLNTAISAHGNTDWHIDTANEFLFGKDMNGSTTAANHCPNSWTRRHMHVGLTNTNHFYYDSALVTPGDDLDATSGIDTAMLFFYAGHGFPPSSWDTLGNKANVSNVSIGDRPGGGQLRYYWQCSCTVFAHGPACCPGKTCSATHPCPAGKDWWYQCPGEFDGSSDSLSTPNIYERWGIAINPDLRMACGSSTCAYCHEGQMNKIWNNYNNLGYDVADSFIDGLKTGSVVPLCITMGGYNVNLTPLVTDTSFTNLPNTSGTSHYHIQYLSNFASKKIAATFEPRLPELLPKLGLLKPRPIPKQLLNIEFKIENDWMFSRDEIDNRGPRVRVNRASGAVYLAGPSKPVGQPPILTEREYFNRARAFLDEQGWQEEFVAEPVGARIMIASVPVDDPKAEQEHAQKNVIVTFKRQVDVEGTRVDVLGEGGVIEVQMNNDGSLLNASKVWRELVGFEQWEPVKPFEQALEEARKQIEEPWAYELDDWTWGYVEEAGNVEQEAMRLVFQFWFAPIDPEGVRELPPLMIEIPA
jgi:hypothetical protein